MESWETHGAIGSFKSGDLLLRGWEVLGGNERLEGFPHEVPELVVVFLQQHDEACGLGVEGGRDIEDSLVDEFDNAVVGDGSLLVQLIVGAACFDDLPEAGLNNHCRC